ncbi:TIGR02677 family protein [Streptomyces sp. bgisy100]|uniref:TIGR02677 family protein n=1 Tax=Streptomyces sp. bgisy100 TaxID=3413783 RepID=UPI003D74C3A3
MEPLRKPTDRVRFVPGSRAGLDAAVLQVLAAAGECRETALGTDDIRRVAGGADGPGTVTELDLAAALERLRAWGLLQPNGDGGEAPRPAEEYERGAVRYSLTRHGEAVIAGVRHALGLLDSCGAPRTAVLDAVAERLDELDRLLAGPATADGRMLAALTELEAHLAELDANTAALHGEPRSPGRAGEAGTAGVPAVRTATPARLQEFLTGLEQRGPALASAVARIEERGVMVLHERALRGAQPPPHGGGDAEAAWLERRREQWELLRAWFRPADGTPARIQRLHDTARQAVLTLLHMLDRITDPRRPSATTDQDFRELARWFAAAPGEDELHRLWAAAFGLTSARHAHLCHPDPELISPAESWAFAQPVEVSSLLRSSGRTERFTRTARVRDVAGLKAARAERARHERAELEAAWDLLRTDGPVRLSDFGGLEHGVFDRLLDLLGRALSTPPDSTGARRGSTGDGRVEVVLREAADGRTAVLRTPHGSLEGPDYLVEVRPSGGAPVPSPRTAGAPEAAE